MPFFADLIKNHHGEFNNILDLGCGELYHVFKKRWGGKYEGLDVRVNIKADYYGDACDLSRFRSNSRDVITGFSTAEHVPNPYIMFEEAVRVCRGTCIFTTDYTMGDKNGDPTHLYSWTPKTLQQLFNMIHSDNNVYEANGILIGVFYRCNVDD